MNGEPRPPAQQNTIPLTAGTARNTALTGTKAANLATLDQAGLPVPPGFVIVPEADLDDPVTQMEVTTAFERLREAGADAVAVRSSATAEDLPDASFAGQQETVLNVRDAERLHDAIVRVRASLYSAATTAYRRQVGIEQAAMAVLVQRQIDARASGAAFGQDPITGEPAIVIEAVAGLGDALMAGRITPDVWRVEPDGRIVRRANGRIVERSDNRAEKDRVGESATPHNDLLTLPEATIREIVRLVHRAEEAFGGPQDVEWVWDGDRVWVLQARPITVRRDRDFFTDHIEGDDWLWTATFLNERFTHPVSPLGWTLVAGALERLALRGPLDLLGGGDIEGPLLKLWRGHPYSRVEAWQRIYKLFPDALLPEDAVGYFPAGDVSLRSAPRTPQWGVHLFRNALRVLRDDGPAASPIHNPGAWQRFERSLDAWLLNARVREATLADLPADRAITAGRQILGEAQHRTEELLRIHRWSLLYADLSYSVLRRLLRARHGPTDGAHRAATLTAGVRSKTAQLNAALDRLAVMVGRREDLRETLVDVQLFEALRNRLAEDDPFLEELATFLDRYGHRFFSLDLADPPYEAAPQALFTLLRARATDSDQPTLSGNTGETPEWWLRPIVRRVRSYVRLREDQRFAWQRILALQRRIALHLGARWAGAGILETADDVFGLTWDELMQAELTAELGAIAARRRIRHDRLRAQFSLAPSWQYPNFLRGSRPLVTEIASEVLYGRPVSPGIARGRACIVMSPVEFDRVRKGDILFTLAPDPGWTPIFGTIAGLVTERGGQLSHAAVVAREYGLPAVAGITGLLDVVRTGDEVLIDGTAGVVRRVDETR